MRAQTSGGLYLSVNDDHLDDNSGEYRVNITLCPRSVGLLRSHMRSAGALASRLLEDSFESPSALRRIRLCCHLSTAFRLKPEATFGLSCRAAVASAFRRSADNTREFR